MGQLNRQDCAMLTLPLEILFQYYPTLHHTASHLWSTRESMARVLNDLGQQRL